MRTLVLNRLRNVKDWLELRNLPFLTRWAAARLFRTYDLDDASVALLWSSDPDALYIEPLIAPDAVVLDVGANLGTFSYSVRRTQGSARVIAFEPIPALAARIRTVFTNIEVLELALSDRSAVEVFRIPYIEGRRCATRGSLGPMVDSTTWRQIQVRTDRLDHVVTNMALGRLDLIKIDVEGHELQVLRGAEQTLRRHRPILLVEIEQRHHGEPVTDIMSYIESLGYVGFFLNRESLNFDSIKRFDPKAQQRQEDMSTHRYVNNFLFLSSSADHGALREKLTKHLRRLLQRSGSPSNASLPRSVPGHPEGTETNRIKGGGSEAAPPPEGPGSA
jgi:FkbM family methyltransferase